MRDEDEAFKRDPGMADYYSNRGLSYANNGEYDKAIADYNQALSLKPAANYLTNRGDAYQFKKDYDHAIADYNEALKIDSKFYLAYNNRGAAYRAKGDLDRAIADYEQAIRLHPGDDTAVENLQPVRRDRARLGNLAARPSPTFDCSTASRPVEKAICSDQELTQLDRDMQRPRQGSTRSPSTHLRQWVQRSRLPGSIPHLNEMNP